MQSGLEHGFRYFNVSKIKAFRDIRHISADRVFIAGRYIHARRLQMTGFQKKLWIGLLIMALLSPLGILLPERFNAEDAWGEWGTETLERLLGYVPEGLRKLADVWKAPIPDYNFGSEGASMTMQVISYIVSGILGVVLCSLTVYVLSRIFKRSEK
jgi:cobalt/nickel transport protein